MGEGARKFATYEDLLQVPEHLVGEIIAGELVTSPRPSLKHAHTSSSLGEEIVGPFQKGKGGGPGGWWILDEPEIHFGKDILVPDLAGWKKENLPELPKDARYCEVAPQWVCEVLSPGTARLDRVRKMPIYCREQVGHIWLIDPSEKTLEVYQNHGKGWLLLGTHAGDSKVRVAPFDAVELDLGTLWLP